MARWARAGRWLSPETRRVLDVGCAFGYGTAHVAAALDRRAPAPPLVIGLEYDAAYAAQARRRYPRLAIGRASADALPFGAAQFDAVLLLDVLEHLANPAAAVAEARRALRPGGVLLLSVPHRGPLARLDSLNRYEGLRARWPGLPPLDPTERGGPCHRHFAVEELVVLLGDDFVVERVARTGLGLAEPANLALLLLCRGLLRSEAAYRGLRYLYYALYLLEDLLPAGRLGYHLMVRARRR
jgi:SAM-dependent methyltransferase